MPTPILVVITARSSRCVEWNSRHPSHPQRHYSRVSWNSAEQRTHGHRVQCWVLQRISQCNKLKVCVQYVILWISWRITPHRRFSTSIHPRVVHSGVPFWMSHLAAWLRSRRFSELNFGPSRLTNHVEKLEKTHCFATFLRFAHLYVLFLLALSLSLFYSFPLSDSSHLYFSSFHIVGSLCSKLLLILENQYIHSSICTDTSIKFRIPISTAPFWPSMTYH